MATVIRVNNMREGYVEVCNYVAGRGEKVSPRGLPTREVRDLVIELTDPTDALPIGVGRKLHLPIAAIEALQLIGGVSDPAITVAASQRFEDFIEPDGEFHGAYGKRIGVQFAHVARKLVHDHDTRQAVITLWNPSLDNQSGKRDYPCTVSLTFSRREDQLHLSTLMRSNDVWLGLAYDAFQFTQLQCTLASVLKVKVGTYTHHAVSAHVYERDVEKIMKLRFDPLSSVRQFTPYGVDGGSGVDGAWARAQVILKGSPLIVPTVSEQWYIDEVKKVRDG